MKTVVFSIETLDGALADFATAWKTGEGDATARIGFETWELMHKVLSPKRLDIVRAMAGAGPLSIREIGRRVGRDFKGVHSDVSLLVATGVVDKDDSGKLTFPYDKIHVDFEIPAAA
jgi:predicted transcriptional regulator